MSDIVKWDWTKIWGLIGAAAGSLIAWAVFLNFVWGLARG